MRALAVVVVTACGPKAPTLPPENSAAATDRDAIDAPATPSTGGPRVPVLSPNSVTPVACEKLGDLVVCGESYEAPSHGGEEFVRTATYTVENMGSTPHAITVTGLDVVEHRGQRMTLGLADVEWASGTHGATTTIDPLNRIALRIRGSGSIAKLRYHVRYHHEARFSDGKTSIGVAAGDLYFRHALRRP